MLHALLLAAVALAPQTPTPPAPAPAQNPPAAQVDPATAAMNAAAELKKKADYKGAATAFENFVANFPDSPRKFEALVEAGVCWFSLGRGAQVMHRNTPEAQANFDKALALFERVTTEQPAAPLASRAQYMKGQTHVAQGQFAKAASEFDAVLEHFKADPSYVGKSLERRAYVRRQTLDAKGAIADLQRWQKEFNAKEQVDAVAKSLDLTLLCDKPAPLFEPEQWLQGEPAPLETLGGQVVALYFSATWCPNCAKELAFVQDLEKRYAPKGLRFVGVFDHGKGQTPESVRAYLRREKIAHPVYIDNGQAATAYKATTIPHLVLIDRLGKVRWCDNPGYLADATIEALLAEGQDAKK